MKFIDTEEKELLAMRNMFIASEIGGVAFCIDRFEHTDVIDFSQRQAAIYAMKSELADLYKQISLMGGHLLFEFKLPFELDNDSAFLDLVSHFGRFSYALKHYIRGTENVDRHISLEEEYKLMCKSMHELCSLYSLGWFEIEDLGDSRYKERYDAWAKAGRKGLWV